MWIFYIPVWLQHFWLSIKLRNLFFFLATNPAIEGFILSDSKFKTLQLVPPEHRPKSLLVKPGKALAEVLDAMREMNVQFPVILKPDVGFRGIKVKKVESKQQLEQELSELNFPAIIQEYCSEPFETGIFYYRYPNEDTGYIPSVTIKEFLKVTGDGTRTLEELVSASPRAILQANRLRQFYGTEYTQIVSRGRVLEVESLGNHNRGTRFIDGNKLVDEELVAIFDKLSHQMQGFYFGRFDIRANSWEALKQRQEFKIIEVNGVGGEPTHIYDSSNSLIMAWAALCHSWRIAARIARINFSNGVKRPSYREARDLWRNYCSRKASLFA